MKNSTILLGFVLAAAVTLAGCRGDDRDETADRARLAALEAAIDAYIGDARCEKPEDCGSIAFGAKPCGGPWSYKVFSVAGLDTVALAGMVAEYNAFNRVLNRRYGWVSDCMVVAAPGVDCLDGRCLPVGPP